ncbi:hypothetical protein Trydic_g16402 [Trypoxylus dichotomus]
MCYLSRWKSARIIPVHKLKKDHGIPEDHYPTSLLSTINKFLETLLLARINDHLDEHRLLEKPFDKIYHEVLLMNMKDFPFSARILKNIRSYLQSRGFHIVVNGSVSPESEQESVLGPSTSEPTQRYCHLRE